MQAGTKEQEELPEEFRVIEISAKKCTGIEELEDMLKEMFFQGELTFNDEIHITKCETEKQRFRMDMLH